ncbi:MAG: hypothetical protein C4K60_04820 [Ideonella sp. MAG2]|nr:MAG: hypothetical protein C4K60_04820 [Ideonella sp. MAG2]
MTQQPDLANIDLHLVRVLHTVISERSVSRAALRLGSTQPQVSAQLKRLRGLTGDALLVRSGTGLVPTDAALDLLTMMVARSHLVLTTGRLFCQRHIHTLPVRVVRCPVACPPLAYYQLWHERNHHSPAQRWLREQVREVTRELQALGGATRIVS